VIGILGSGFGLYGYLPALASISNQDILLQRRYESIYDSRLELSEFKNRIQWVDSIEQIISFSELIVFALQPNFQYKLIIENTNQLVNKKLILEKPLAKNTEDADRILFTLNRYNINFRVAYTLIYTSWASKLKFLCDSNCSSDNILIEWIFLAHHYETKNISWKRDSTQGGGIINFYGIHFIALCVFLGFQKLISSSAKFFSNNDIYEWECELQNLRGKKIKLRLNSFSKKTRFRISLKSSSIYDMGANTLIDQENLFIPFDKKNKLSLDPRIELLQKVYLSFDNDTSSLNFSKIYLETNKLWSLILNETNRIGEY
jgi:hypothetical protein